MAPHKITETKVEAICESVAMGAPLEAAARAAGIHPATLFRWQEAGEHVLQMRAEAEAKRKAKPDETEIDELNATLCEGIQRARGECEANLVAIAYGAAAGRPAKIDEKTGKVLEPAMEPDGRLALEMLGRKFPGRWSKRLSVSDDSKRDPAPMREEVVALHEAAFKAAAGEAALDGVDPENLMPPVFES